MRGVCFNMQAIHSYMKRVLTLSEDIWGGEGEDLEVKSLNTRNEYLTWFWLILVFPLGKG